MNKKCLSINDYISYPTFTLLRENTVNRHVESEIKARVYEKRIKLRKFPRNYRPNDKISLFADQFPWS